MLFDCSRTIVREALTRLAARDIVTVSSRRGWYVIEPSQDEAREAFQARRVIEMGLIRCTTGVSKTAVKQLKSHLAREKAAVKGSDVGLRSFLLGDFHVCLAECLGNSLLADTLIAMLYQSSHDAAQSCNEHVEIVQALEKGDLVRAEKLMQAHIGSVQSTLKLQPANGDPLAELRNALSPMSNPTSQQAKPKLAQGLHASSRESILKHVIKKRSGAAKNTEVKPEDNSTYLGALL